MSSKKILVTGAGGMVGAYVKSVFSSDTPILTDRKTLDVTSRKSVLRVIGDTRPDIVLHLAAATDVDRCETEKKWAYQTNVVGTKNVADACRENDALMIYVSTGGIFDGKKEGPYNEEDKANPRNVYAETKLEGEKTVRSLLKKYFIVRAGWMMGGGAGDKKFVGKIVSLCQTKDNIKVVDDNVGSLTFARDFLNIVSMLIRTIHYSVYHVANTGVCSRYEIAKEIAKILKSSVVIEPVPSSVFSLPAPRAKSEAIVNHRLQELGLDAMPPWQSALKSYLGEWLHI